MSNASSCTAAGFTHSPVIPSVMYEMSDVVAGAGCVQLRHSPLFSVLLGVSVTKRLISIDGIGDAGVIGVACVLGQIQPQLREHRSTRPQLSPQSATR